jgi:hypothetical protein
MKKSVICVVLVLISVSLLFTSCHSGKKTPPDDSEGGDNAFEEAIEIYGETKNLVFFNGKNKTVIARNDGSILQAQGNFDKYEVSLDAVKGAFLVDSAGENNGVLYYIPETGDLVKVAEKVQDFVLADSGDGLIYWTEFDYEEQTATLNRFDGINSNSTVIQENTYFPEKYEEGTAAISPDSKTVFYATDVVIDFDVYTLVALYESTAYISTDGALGEVFTNGAFPLAISDKAEYIYYIDVSDNNADLAAQKGKNGEKTVLAPVGEKNFFLNKDYSQFIYCDNNKTYISVQAGAGTKIADCSVYRFITPAYAQARNHDEVGLFRVFGFDDFKGKAFTDFENLYFTDENLQGEKIARTETMSMADDGKTVFFTEWDNFNLKTVNLLDENLEIQTIVESTVSNFKVVNGEYLYFTDGSYNLNYMKIGDNSATLISNEIEYLSLRMSDSVIYYLKGSISNNSGELYAVQVNENENKPVKIAEKVSRLNAYNNNVYYFANLDQYGFCDIFRKQDNGEFEKFAEEIHLDYNPNYNSPTCLRCGRLKCDGDCALSKECEICGEYACFGNCAPCENCGERYCWGDCFECPDCGRWDCFGTCTACEFCGSIYCPGYCVPCEKCGEAFCWRNCNE